MSADTVLELVELGFPWHGLDPFIFTVHHVDDYPAGNDLLGPVVPLAGRNIGSDFSYLDGWSMYHGDVVPGFPQHPAPRLRNGHRRPSRLCRPLGLARRHRSLRRWRRAVADDRLRDHARRDVSAHPGQDGANPLELFQIWLNLPPESKMVPAYFSMLWGEDIPTDRSGPGSERRRDGRSDRRLPTAPRPPARLLGIAAGFPPRHLADPARARSHAGTCPAAPAGRQPHAALLRAMTSGRVQPPRQGRRPSKLRPDVAATRWRTTEIPPSSCYSRASRSERRSSRWVPS